MLSVLLFKLFLQVVFYFLFLFIMPSVLEIYFYFHILLKVAKRHGGKKLSKSPTVVLQSKVRILLKKKRILNLYNIFLKHHLFPFMLSFFVSFISPCICRDIQCVCVYVVFISRCVVFCSRNHKQIL